MLNRNEKGFTLIELLIVIAIAVILMATIFGGKPKAGEVSVGEIRGGHNSHSAVFEKDQ